MNPNTSKLADYKKELLPFVKKHAYLKLDKPIQLASGKMSDTYFDGRRITLHPEGMTLFAHAIIQSVDLSKIDAVGGPSIGADPISTAVSLIAYSEYKKVLPAFLIRKEPKKHGLQRQVEGWEITKGMKLLIVEDVITSGKSVLQAIGAVEALGAVVAQVICLLDREEGGREALKGYPYTPVFSRKDIES
jgi:orotate phosphoribosyltransferase